MLFCKKDELHNESDVEQKFILPMLTSKNPLGFSYSSADFRTKADLRQIKIDKGNSAKIYYPDYLIIIRGLPALIIEAKHPQSDLDNDLREARLYATEINSGFPKNINPCSKIIISNGFRTIGCSWDTSISEVDLSFDEVFIENPKYNDLVKFASRTALAKYADDLYRNIRGGTVFQKPLRILGGDIVQNEELPQNSFGTSLALEYRHLFNPDTRTERVNIVKNAYVTSTRRQKHVDPIEKIIRAANPPSITQAQQIEDTTDPKEIVKILAENKSLKHEIILLIGGVGSGKSTFTDYIQEVSLPAEVKAHTLWVSIDLNVAPLTKDKIYIWLIKQISNSLKNAYVEIDFDDIVNIKKLYSVQLRQLEKGVLSLFEKHSEKYNELIANKILELQANIDLTLNALIRFLCAERGKSLIIVLDNCDNRNLEDQLLMFQVAKWLQDELECLIFLPLRDTTYDHHRKEPPLDTVIKDLVFRIDPPALMEVISRRVDFALKQMKLKGSNALYYDLPNGMRVEYPQSDQGMYLICILRSLFQADAFFRRVIAGIAGRDIRKGLEIFLDFCKSGHISSAEILKIRHANGTLPLPKHVVTRVLIRGNRKYYQDASSVIKNLFFSLPEDTIPDPKVRIAILRWLKNRYRLPGSNGVWGYFKVSELISNLTPYGHSADRVRLELDNLAKAQCILAESQDNNIKSDDELISISPSGHVHLDLLADVNYLASCSEDVWYKDSAAAKRIALRITDQSGNGHFTTKSALENAEELLTYLSNYQNMFGSSAESVPYFRFR